MVQSIFTSVLVLSAVGTALFLVILAVKPLIYKKFGSFWHYCMLILTAVLMLLPIRITPLWSAPEDNFSEDFENGYVTEYTNEETPVLENTTNYEPVSPKKEQIPSARTGWAFSHFYLKTASFIWLIASLILFALRYISYFVFCRRLKKESFEVHIPEAEEYMGKGILVRRAKGISSPFIIGLLRPVLFLPNRDLCYCQLDNILRHEAAHLKRGDILVRWIVLVTKCVHWFNPIVYILAKGIETECEISCDAFVVRNMTGEERADYAKTILSLLPQKKDRHISLTTEMAGGKKILARRLLLIKSAGKAKPSMVVLSIIIAVTLGLSAMFSSGIANGTFVVLADSEGAITKVTVEYSENGALAAFVADAETSMLDVYSEYDGEYIMSIPYAVMETFPASKREGWNSEDFGFLQGIDVYCGRIDSFVWAVVCSGPVMSSSNVNICTSTDGGRNWYIDNTAKSISKGIVEDVWFVSESEGYISYSGGGYGRGISKTLDGGKTWEHSMEYGAPLPLSKEDALKMLKNQLKIAYIRAYGSYTPRNDDPGEMSGDGARLPYIIENLEITGDDGEYYTVPVIWEFLIHKETGNIFKLYRGLDIMLIPFDPYEETALAFAG